jgi:hypothetical protein
LVCIGQVKSGSIYGKVYHPERNNRYVDNLMIWVSSEGRADTGTVTDISGFYEITNLPFEKYVLRISGRPYWTERDTIELSKESYNVRNDFVVKLGKVPLIMPDSLKEYHNLFSSYKPDEILKIWIDSIDQNFRTLYLTFTNKTKYPLYLIEDIVCFHTIETVVRNESGDYIRPYMLNACDQGFNETPFRENQIKIEPYDSIKFPPVRIHEYAMKRYPEKGRYSLRVIYNGKDYKFLPGLFSNPKNDYYKNYKDAMEVMNYSIRGRFFSDNMIYIEK